MQGISNKFGVSTNKKGSITIKLNVIYNVFMLNIK